MSRCCEVIDESNSPIASLSAMVGGDNASRSIAIGMVLGAYHGVNAIPLDLKEGLNQWEHSAELLERLPLLAKKRHSDEL